MRRALVPLILVIIFSTTVNAETYIINGRATYADNTQLILQDISIDCESTESNCLQFKGTTTQTDKYGNFTLAFSVDEQDDGTQILLSAKGETFVHTIDIELLRANGGTLYQNIKLNQFSAPAGSGIGSLCCFLIFIIIAIYVFGKTARMLSTPRGRMEFRGYRPEKMVECPVCQITLPNHQLVKHLIVDHDIEMFEAGEMAGKLFKKLRTGEEE